MYILHSYSIAVVFCVITMFCWGSWANTQKLTGKEWPFQLFYWDYSLGIALFTLMLACTLGSIGNEGRGFLSDFQQASPNHLLSSLIGGVLFNFANLLLVIAIELTGMAVAFPIGIGAALVIGVITNYLDKPTGNPLLLFGGVGLVTLAILLDALAYKASIQSSKQTPRKGILFAMLAGVAMGFFYKFVAHSMVQNFSTPEVGLLTPYTALVVFSIGILFSNFIFNTYCMYQPFFGAPVKYTDYKKLGSTKLHLIGIAGGAIWGLGMSFSILASEQAGTAIAYGLGQGATLVAALWGVFVWKEFKELPRSKNWLLATMFLCFVVGLSLIVISKNN